MIVRLPLLVAFFSPSLFTSAAESRGDSGRPRGVGPEFAKFYKATPDNFFTCISNPTIRIPHSAVNDDYCDCPDGSDEPGTAACSYLSPLSPPQPNLSLTSNQTLVLPGFYCKNKGHIPSYVRFELVNDGICDYDVCCDGSEEFGHVGGVKCEDRCATIGAEYRKHEEIRQKGMQRAMKKRKELQFDADRKRKEVEDKITATEIKIKGLERKLAEAEENVRETERREKNRVVKSDAAGKGKGKLGVLLGLGKDRVNELRDTAANLRTQRDNMVARVTELEMLLNDLKTDYNPNFNDAAVKKAVQGWEDYAARDSDDTWTEAQDRDVLEIIKEDGAESGINWAEFENVQVDDNDAAAIYSLTSYLPPVLQTWLSGTLANLRQTLINNGILPDYSEHSNIDDSPAVKNARQARDAAQVELSATNAELSNGRDDLNKDYGPGGVFRALKDQCVEKESGEYVYSHCFLSRTTQRQKKGGGDTNMGNFMGFETEYVDDDLPPDGKGLGRGERIVLKYENGQHCWSGPNRSTRVVLGCSEHDEIYKVSESEKCVYRMEVGTPAVCGWENRASEKQDNVKDEL